MTQTLNLTKDNPSGSSNGQNNFNNNSNRKKKSSPLKIIIGIIIAIFIVLALVVTFFLYKNYSEVNAFKQACSNFNSVVDDMPQSCNDSTANELSSYATSLNNLAREFNIFSKEIFLGENNRILAKKYSDFAKYLSCKENFLIPVLKLKNECDNTNGSPSQIQGIINGLQNLLTNDDFVQMTTLYNNSPFIQNKLTGSVTPIAMKNTITSSISTLTAAKNAESFDNFGNAIDNAFLGTSSSSSNSNSSDTSVPTAYPSPEDEAADNSSSSTPGYIQTLHSLSGKYQDLISNAIDQFGEGNGGNLILSGNPSEDAPVIKNYYNTWDSILNDVWQDLEANLPSDQMSILRSQETTWINSKTGKSPGEVAQMTKDRAMLLINKYIT